jgi:antitoxin component of MazEF toxin-antitoxin module
MLGISSSEVEASVPHITVGRWGKNLAVRFPGNVAREVGLREGERVEIETQDGAIVIRRAPPYFTLEDLFRGRSPKAWRAIYAGAFNWGDDVGREAVEE